jgi:proline iminopeptidase
MPKYPDIEPYETGLLDTGDGNLVYWETCGDPDGVPALIVHGGPGSGCTAGNRRSFDPEKFRIIIFDQRNCGRSLPHASDPAADLSLNTTGHLLRDMEQMREHLGVEKWLLRGGSWGVTLSLAYAERHPERVSGMLMLSVTSTRRLELDWLYRGVGRFFPEAARAWPGAELIIIEDSGHTGSTTMTDQMHAAADRLYEQITNPA